MTREDLIKIARLAVAGIHRPEDCENPVSYDPPEWLLEALSAAWKAGRAESAAEVVEHIATLALIEAAPVITVDEDSLTLHHESRAGVTGAQLVEFFRDEVRKVGPKRIPLPLAGLDMRVVPTVVETASPAPSKRPSKPGRRKR